MTETNFPSPPLPPPGPTNDTERSMPGALPPPVTPRKDEEQTAPLDVDQPNTAADDRKDARKDKERESSKIGRAKEAETDDQISTDDHLKNPDPDHLQRESESCLTLEMNNLSELYHEATAVNATLDKENKRLQALCAELTEKLRQRTADLSIAEAFFNKADVISGGDAVRMVQGFNAEVFQLAARWSEAFKLTSRPHPDEQVYHNARERCRARVGRQLTSALAKSKGNPDSIQTVIQGCLTSFCSYIVKLWLADRQYKSANDFLAELYNILRKSENQSVAGKWRALARSKGQEYLRSKGQNDEAIIKSFVAMIGADIAHILIVGGLNFSHAESCQIVRRKTEGGLRLIVEKALALRKAIGEDVVSSDLAIGYFPPETVFDGAKMDDAGNFDIARVKEPPRILCTSELGLVRITPEQPPNFLLKPKVNLELVLSS